MRDQHDTRDAYMRFGARLAKAMGVDWNRVKSQVEICYDYLTHIPDAAYSGMERIAVDTWDAWPRNYTKALREIYTLWRKSTNYSPARAKTECEYCAGAGFFSATIPAEIAPGRHIRYTYTFRCGACRNWAGTISAEKFPAAWPLELKSRGYEVSYYSADTGGRGSLPAAVERDLRSLLRQIGERI